MDPVSAIFGKIFGTLLGAIVGTVSPGAAPAKGVTRPPAQTTPVQAQKKPQQEQYLRVAR